MSQDSSWLQREDLKWEELKAEGTREGWRAACGLGTAFQEATFESWEHREEIQLVFGRCLEYADQFPVGVTSFGYPSLWLCGSWGTGKTHLAAAITHGILARSPVDSDDCPVRYETGPELLLRIRQSYNPRPRNPDRESDKWLSEYEIYEQLRSVPLLILDDVGDKEPPSAHTMRTYFMVIDARYSAGLPIVLCSNVGTEELELVVGPASLDRLREMTCGVQYNLQVKSYRELKANRLTLDEVMALSRQEVDLPEEIGEVS